MCFKNQIQNVQCKAQRVAPSPLECVNHLNKIKLLGEVG